MYENLSIFPALYNITTYLSLPYLFFSTYSECIITNKLKHYCLWYVFLVPGSMNMKKLFLKIEIHYHVQVH